MNDRPNRCPSALAPTDRLSAKFVRCGPSARALPGYGEGLETRLSARAIGYRPVWAAGSAGAIETFPVLDGVESLTLLTEHDGNGANAKAVEACTRRWQAAGREVFYLDPPPDCGDLNDALQKRMAHA